MKNARRRFERNYAKRKRNKGKIRGTRNPWRAASLEPNLILNQEKSRSRQRNKQSKRENKQANKRAIVIAIKTAVGRTNRIPPKASVVLPCVFAMIIERVRNDHRACSQWSSSVFAMITERVRNDYRACSHCGQKVGFLYWKTYIPIIL